VIAFVLGIFTKRCVICVPFQATQKWLSWC